MIYFVITLFFGALAVCLLPELLYDRRPVRFAPRIAPPQARRFILVEDPQVPR